MHANLGKFQVLLQTDRWWAFSYNGEWPGTPRELPPIYDWTVKLGPIEIRKWSEWAQGIIAGRLGK